MVQYASTAATEDMNGGAYPVVCASSTVTGMEILPSVFVSLRERADETWCICKGTLNAGCHLCAFAAMEIQSDVKTVRALLDQFFEKKRLLILSAPNMSDPDYQLQNVMIQVRRLMSSHDSSGQQFLV